jgi:hypothetical protein
LEGSGHGLIWYCPNFAWGTEENHDKPQDSWSRYRDLNLGRSEYEAGVLTIEPLNMFLGQTILWPVPIQNYIYRLLLRPAFLNPFTLEEPLK